MVPMLAAMPILAPLWNTSREDVFYTRSNMWRLRYAAASTRCMARPKPVHMASEALWQAP